ncbi:hypothetical protein [Mesobacillus harenae]|uniref:hypothetical protein n=1 Tax=Mesobacillus harenae TaxID=2213203 RepID=UPI001580B613|nr:hypothetical protein [Mesobacillus harenae]
MAANQYYNMCKSGIGRSVRIRTRDGRTHIGIIDRVTRGKVYLRPIGGRPNYGGFGYGGYYGPGYGFGSGFVGGIAIGLITSLAFLPFFWW